MYSFWSISLKNDALNHIYTSIATKLKVLFTILTIQLGVVYSVNGQSLTSPSATGNASKKSSTYSTVTGSSVTIDATGLHSPFNKK